MLDIGFFTSTLVTLLVGIAFLIAFLYFAKKIEKIKFIHNLTLMRKTRWLVYFILGLIVGLASPLINATQISLEANYGFVSDLAIIVVIGFFTSSYLYTGATIVYLISSMLFNVANHERLLLFTYLFIVLLINGALISFIRVLSLQRFFWAMAISLPISLFSLIFAFLIVPEPLVQTAYVLPWVAILFMVLFYFIGNVIVNFVGKTERLTEAIQFDKNHFVLSHYANDYLANQVSSNNYQRGFLMLFDFSGSEKIPVVDGRNKYDEIVTRLTKNLVSKFENISKTKLNWFISKAVHHGVFIPFNNQNTDLNLMYEGNELPNRMAGDMFVEYEKILRSIPTKVRYNKEIYEIQVHSAATIYGIHSCDFNQLITRTENVLKQYDQIKNKNLIQVYNPKLFHLLQTTANLYSDLAEQMDVKNLQVFLKNYSCVQNPKEHFFYYEAALPAKLIFNKLKIVRSIDSLQLKSTLIRLMAMRVIRAYVLSHPSQQLKLVIDYSLYELSNPNFNLNNFLSKLEKQGINFKKLILNIPFEFENFQQFDAVTIKNLNNIKNQGIGLSVSGIGSDEIAVLKEIKFDYVIENYRFKMSDYSNKDAVNEYVKTLTGFFSRQNLQILFFNPEHN
ncbi:hypothetical protein [[Mycoplasma] testudinis]|uniref:hypothetical protein n=1 Tax=[Mycoplasma] testudinis TaxID=33924 RepID=UPI000483838B|nr:hypothetical protein [[Mycoplasma] testudinis]